MAAVLSMDELMLETMDSFKVSLLNFSTLVTNFSSATAVKDDVINMNIRSLPSASTYSSGSGGYKNGATAAHTLLDAVPVTLDQWPTVPIYTDTDSQITSKIDQLTNAAKDTGFVLARSVLQTVLGKAVAANFSTSATQAAANVTVATLESIQGQLNTRGAAPTGRFGIVNTAVANALGADPRMASKDFLGQQNQGMAYRHWVNVAGFSDIWEYPELPSNSENVIGFFGEKRAFAFASRLPDHASQPEALGIPDSHVKRVVTDPETGLSLLGVGWTEQGTMDVYFVVTLLYGVTAGKNGGSADALTDKAGIILKSS